MKSEKRKVKSFMKRTIVRFFKQIDEDRLLKRFGPIVSLRLTDQKALFELLIVAMFAAAFWVFVYERGTTSVSGNRTQHGRKYEFLLDTNTAPKTELLMLPGIGPTLAERIMEHRKIKPFESPDDLIQIKGIGKKKLEAVRPFVIVGQQTAHPTVEHSP